MSGLRVSFGDFGNNDRWYLYDTDPNLAPIDLSLLANPLPTGVPVSATLSAFFQANLQTPIPPLLPITPHDGVLVQSYNASQLTGSLFGGKVDASTSGDAHTVDVTGAWNSVKNVQAVSDNAETLTFKGFVHVDVMVGTHDDADSSIEVIGAKRGNIITGAGNDTITVHMVENELSWIHDFRISSGAGDDTITLGGLTDAERGADPTYAALQPPTTGPLDATGVQQRSFIDAGSGNDRVIGYNSQDIIYGGTDTGTVHANLQPLAPSGFAYSIGGTAKGAATTGHDSTLYKIDLATGAATAVGKVAASFGPGSSGTNLDVEAMDFDPVNGFLYATVKSPGNAQGLFKIDPTTGATTLVSTAVGALSGETQGMAFDLDGNMWLTGNGSLAKVDPGTGQFTLVGHDTLSKKIGGLAIDPTSGKLFGIAETGSTTTLYQIDKATGQVVGSGALSGVPTNAKIEGLAFDGAGKLWGLDRVSGALWNIDPVTKAAQKVSTTLGVSQQTGDGFESLAIKVDTKLVGLTVEKGDVLTGGGGHDLFAYQKGDGVDTITDFHKGEDTLALIGIAKADVHVDVIGTDAFVRFVDASPDGFVDNAVIKLAGVGAFTADDILFA